MAKVLLKKSSVSSNAPGTGDLEYGEVAINYADGRLYYKNSSNEINVETLKAEGQKCPVCWKINKNKCERHSI